MRIESEKKLDYEDVLIRPKRSTLISRKDIYLEREFNFYHSPKIWKGVPIVSANMTSCGTFEMAKTLSKQKMITFFHKYYSVDDFEKFFKTFNNPNYICYTLGIRSKDFEKLEEMKKRNLLKNFSFICLDVPNGYLERFGQAVEKLREICPTHIIIAGNVVTNEMTEELILKGADIVKVGIGPGAVCTTRKMTGVGFPQLSAVIECADAAHGIANERGVGLIIADGGCVFPGDVAKAFCAGADLTMLGSMLSGFKESGGKIKTVNKKKFKEYFGSSSGHALKNYYGKKDSHRASEGRYCLIPYKGEIKYFLQDLFGSLRSTATYIGARKLKEFARRATFIQVNKQLNQSLEKYDLGKN
jgi:GMP reductase